MMHRSVLLVLWSLAAFESCARSPRPASSRAEREASSLSQPAVASPAVSARNAQRRSIRPGGVASRGTFPSVAAVSVGRPSVCVLTTAGAVVCWGIEYADQASHSPKDVAEPGTVFASDVVALSGAADTSCVRLRDDRVTCWDGRGVDHQLPEATAIKWAQAVDTATEGARTVAVSSGGTFRCALASTGAVRCWGSGQYFGVPGSRGAFAPHETRAVALHGKATAISVGDRHACAALAKGGMQCWGDGTDGKLGYGDNLSAEQPRSRPILLKDQQVVLVAAGYQSTCAVLVDGTARCWGRMQDGTCQGCGEQAARNFTAADEAKTIRFARAIRQIGLGEHAACAVLDGGELRCWHAEDEGNAILGSGVEHKPSVAGAGTPVDPERALQIDIGGPVQDVRIGMIRNILCAIRKDGALFCWGRNDPAGILGYDRSDDIGDDETPMEVGPVPLGVR